MSDCKEIIARGAETVDAERHAILSGLHTPSADEIPSGPCVEKLHLALIAGIKLDVIVYIPGQCTSDIDTRVAHLEARAESAQIFVGPLAFPSCAYRSMYLRSFNVQAFSIFCEGVSGKSGSDACGRA